MVIDTMERSINEYKETNPFFAPIPFTIYTTLNDWDEDFPESVDCNYYYPRSKFMD